MRYTHFYRIFGLREDILQDKKSFPFNTDKNMFICLGLLFLLGGCEFPNFFSKKAPDEFKILTRAPLSMPPNYDLRPPLRGGKHILQTQNDSKKLAAEALAGKESPHKTKKDLSQGEDILIQKTKGHKAPSDIAETLDYETGQRVKKEKSVIDDLIFWEKKNPGSDPLEAKNEEKRLEKEGYILNKK